MVSKKQEVHMPTPEYQKTGYLYSDYKLFHISDHRKRRFSCHYHDFDKVLVLLRGRVRYIIEGKAYPLQPYDVVLVPHHAIHYPEVDFSAPYERLILYISPLFLESYKTEGYDLSDCFRNPRSNVLRHPSMAGSDMLKTLLTLDQSCGDDAYAASLYEKLLFLQFMIQLNRTALSTHAAYSEAIYYHPKINDIILHINSHLTEDLSIDALAEHFLLSKYYMMRLFKAQTGYTIGNYINSKRLLSAREMIMRGKPLTQVCYDCGFQDYSAFSRAFKAMFGMAPKSFRP